MLKDKITPLLDLSESNCIEPSDINPLNDEEILEKISDFPVISERSLIIVNDHYRPTPSRRIIKLLRNAGKIKTPVTFLIATGSHEPPAENIAVKLTGALKKDTILYHNIYTAQNYLSAGTTSRGTEVFFNSIINDFNRMFTISSVEPHYFAGFTGGAKSLVPGITSKQTIIQNHKWAMDPNSLIMRTDGNPVFEDIWEAAGLITPLEKIFSMQLVNHDAVILNVSSGPMPVAFDEAKNKSREVFGKPVENKFDRIISFVRPPLDKNLYQAQKAIENTRTVLNDGGSFVLIAQCGSGIGTDNFFERLKSLGTAENVLNTLSFKKYEFGDHKAYSFAKLARRAQLFYIGSLSKEIASQAFMKKISINELANMYKKWTVNGDNILIDNAGGFNTFFLKAVNQ